jgi:cytochrome c-type biogenesis protein CcmH/NrfF
MHVRMASFVLFLFALVLVTRGYAQTGDMETKSGAPAPDLAARRLGVDPESLPRVNAEQAALAKAIGKEVVCLCGTCPKHTITDCDCGWAGMNKRVLQHAVANGESRDEIVRAYRDAYGDQVLAMLPKEGGAEVAWILPWAAGFLGLLAVFIVGRRYAVRAKVAAREGKEAPDTALVGSDDTRAQLAKELEELD